MPSTDPADHLERAPHLLALGRPDEAVDLAQRHLASWPEDPRALAILTIALLSARRYPEALTAANRLVVAEPWNAQSHRLASVALHHLGSGGSGAIRAAREAVRLGPLQAENHTQLALVLAVGTASDRQRARESAAQAVALDPHDADAHFAVGLTAAKPKDQRAAYARALALDPQHSGAANNELVARGRTWSLNSLVQGYLGVLGQEPSFELARTNLVGLMYRFVRRFYLGGILLVLVFVIWGATDPGWSPWRFGLGVAALAVAIWYAVAMYRAVPPGPRLHLAQAWRADRLLIATTLHALAVVAVALVGLMVPGAVPVAYALAVVLIWANVALAVASGVRRRRRARG